MHVRLGAVSNDLMGDLIGYACGFIETNRVLAWLLGCLAAWLLGCLAAVGVGGKSYFPLRSKLRGSAKVDGRVKAPGGVQLSGAFSLGKLAM